MQTFQTLRSDAQVFAKEGTSGDRRGASACDAWLPHCTFENHWREVRYLRTRFQQFTMARSYRDRYLFDDCVPAI